MEIKSHLMSLYTILGCGNIGGQLADYLLRHRHAVTALVRSAEKKEALNKRGIIPIIGDLDHPESLGDLSLIQQTLLYLVPPATDSLQDERVHNLLAHMEQAGHANKVVYISTSGVYGDCKGAWISEDHPVQPQSDRAKRRLSAENSWISWAQADQQRRLVILRVGGIYGPGRLPIKRLEKGLPILLEQQSPFSNRIHSEDLIRICVAAADNNSIPKIRIYNISDGQPTSMSHYFKSVARLLDLPLPPEVDWQGAEDKLTPELLSYLQESRRMDNSRMIEELGIKLIYPQLDVGLQACI